jgi:hypothetical protein
MSLIKPWEHDCKVQVILLELIIPALLSVIKRILADHLDGGKWDSPTTDLQEKTIAAPKHNKYCESVFGYLDRFLRQKPNSTLLAMEAYVLFCHNKTLEWINSKTDKERQQLMDFARKEKKVRQKFKERRNQIHQERQRILQEKVLEEERKKTARIKKLENYTNQILIWGLWQTEEEVDQELSRSKTQSDKQEAISAQLNFRNHVLKQKCDDQNVYVMSELVSGRRKKLSISKLSANVKKLIQHSFTITVPPENAQEQSITLVGKKVMHAFEGNGERVWHSGHVISQVCTMAIPIIINPKG